MRVTESLVSSIVYAAAGAVPLPRTQQTRYARRQQQRRRRPSAAPRGWCDAARTPPPPGGRGSAERRGFSLTLIPNLRECIITSYMFT